jgi:N-methylhydantoinase A
MPLDLHAAAESIDRDLARPLGLSLEDAAAGVVRLAEVKMALGVRGITTERGLDPRDYALVAYGGGGPLHASSIARELGIPRVVIPPAPSTFSAWGMLAADLRHDLVRTVLEALASTDSAWAARQFDDMNAEMVARLPQVGLPVVRRAVDMRYLGQIHTVTVELPDTAMWDQLRGQFDAAHKRVYGYAAADVPVELINLRLTLVVPIERSRLPQIGRAGKAPVLETPSPSR